MSFISAHILEEHLLRSWSNPVAQMFAEASPVQVVLDHLHLGNAQIAGDASCYCIWALPSWRMQCSMPDHNKANKSAHLIFASSRPPAMKPRAYEYVKKKIKSLHLHACNSITAHESRTALIG